MAAHRRQRQHRRVTTPVVVLEAGVRTPNFAPDGPSPPAETLLRTAVSRHLLARRKPGGSNPLTSTPPLMTSTNAGHLHVRGRAREDGLRRLLKVYKGKSLEARQDTVLIMLLLDTAPAVGSWSAPSWTIVDLDLDVLLVLGKGRRERALPLATRRRWRWTATCTSAIVTSMPTCPGSGLVSAGGSRSGGRGSLGWPLARSWVAPG